RAGETSGRRSGKRISSRLKSASRAITKRTTKKTQAKVKAKARSPKVKKFLAALNKKYGKGWYVSARPLKKFAGTGKKNIHPTTYNRLYKQHVGSAPRKNVEMGYTDATGFHPVRASKDYDESRAGEGGKHFTQRRTVLGKAAKKRLGIQGTLFNPKKNCGD